ncbi:helix-turn-helix domain-containing protein [Halobacillus massiliensis]|uniref:helix-turn-helix domain-containing protein n=1 Tax=Halobacillus massiliensis TaxID=1926286 RepID=UPI0015C4B1F3|nr:helix-turn-helix domain-containing protein [Halobacillus massiliensis]
MEIGARLQEAREAKQLSLEEVQERTKIQKRYLQAIEKNDFSILPGKFYTRAFIREYASAVGLDPEQVMEEHKSELPSTEEEQSITYSRVQRTKNEGYSSTRMNSGGFSKTFPTIVTVALIVGGLFVAWFFIMQIAEPDSGTTGNQSEDQVEGSFGSSDEESSSGNGQSEEEGGDSASDGSDNEAAQEETEEESQMEISLAETGSGGFPEHTYEISGAKDRELKIEFEGETYLEVESPKDGEAIADPRIYSSADEAIIEDISDQEEVYVLTGSVPGLKVYINDEEIEFPTDNLTQKLLIKFEE